MAWPRTRITGLVGIEFPIVQAPMASVTTPEMVAAVSAAGGLGSLGGAMTAPDDLRAAIRRIRELTDRPFAVNLFAWSENPPEAEEELREMHEWLAPHREELGVEAPEVPGPLALVETMEAQIEVIAEEEVPVFSWTFGIPDLERVKAAGAVTIGTATTPDEAAALEEAGVDAVLAQGYEAGGHRGAFLRDPAESLVGLFALIPQIADRVDIPVIAAGGIVDGRGIAAALTLGADAAALGTAYLVTGESAATEAHKQRLIDSAPEDTVVTSAYTGRAARTIGTSLIGAIEASELSVPPFPAQAMLTQPLRAAAADDPESEHVFMLGGQGGALARPMGAGELTVRLAEETERILS